MTQNYFTMLDLPVSYRIDENQLKNHFLEKQKKAHPDKFIQASTFEKKQALIESALINEAYLHLKMPLSRAVYWLKINGIEIDAETDTLMSPDFLEMQMQLREQLEDAFADDKTDLLPQLHVKINEDLTLTQKNFESYVSEIPPNFVKARQCAREWQFYDRLQQEIEERICQL